MKKTSAEKYSDTVRLPFRLGAGYPDVVPVIRSDRKTVSLELKRDGTILVRAPRRMSEWKIREFLSTREDWLRAHLAKQQQIGAEGSDRLTEEEIDALFRDAVVDLPARVRRFAPIVGVSYGRITIRNQRTRWGSCSAAGNLNFNCLLMLAPEEARDYVVIHELCHRIEMNHSARFWAEVARVCPNYKAQRKWFREHGPVLMKRMFG